MKKYLLFLFTCFLPFFTSAQNLTESRRTSYYTYIFQLTGSESRIIYKKDLYEADQSYFHTVVDSFPTETSYRKKLPYGNYLVTYVEGGELVYELRSVNNVNLLVLTNKVDLSILLTDSLGNTIPDARVKIRKTHLPFNPKTGTYLLSKARRKGVNCYLPRHYFFSPH